MVEARNLVVRYGQHTVLDDVSLSVAPGEIVVVMGSSGGGKSTLLKCLSGLIRPTSGSVTVDGISVAERPEDARRKMGMVFQSAALFDYLTVEDNVLFGVRRHLELKPKEALAWCRDCLARVGLDDRARGLYPAELSGGMRKRAGIARAIALRPKLLLYDEPTTGLDPITTYTIDELMVRLREDLGVTSLVVSHDVSSVMRTADRVAFLSKGKLVFEGDVEAFTHSDEPAIAELVRLARATNLSSEPVARIVV